MQLRHYSSEGVVLKRKNFLEADRILTIYSKDLGKITLLAKGVRKPKSRKRGSIEVFSYVKFSAAKTKGMDIITEAEIIDSYQEIRVNLKRLSVAYFFMEVVAKTTGEEEKHSGVFELLVDYLEKLKSDNKTRNLRENFAYDILTRLGYWPSGRKMTNHDAVVEEITEKRLASVRVGKKILQ
jgi:DNA repair protein RecO (recombination protein O)